MAKSTMANHNSSLYPLYLIGFFIVLALPLLPLPFFGLAGYLTPPDFGKTMVFKIIFSAILLLLVCQLLFQRNPDLFTRVKKISMHTMPFWLLLLLFASYFLATLFSLDIRYSLWGSPYRGGGFVAYGFYILFAAISFLLLQKKDWQKLWDFSILIGVLVSLVALISYFGIFTAVFIAQYNALSSTIGGPTILGLYLIILAFPALSFAVREQHKIKKVLYGMSFLLFCWVILLTISQGAYLALAIGSLYFLFFYPRMQDNKKVLVVKWLVAALIITGIALSLFIKYNPKNPLNDNYLFATMTDWHMDQSRLSAWKVSVQAFLHRPILGYGPENFTVGFDKYYDPSLPLLQKSPSTADSWWDRPHNFMLNVLSDAGVIGLVSFLLLFGFIFFRLYKLRNTEHRIISHGLQTAFVAYFTDLFFNFDSFSSFLILFFITGYSLSLLIPHESSPMESNQKKFIGIKNFLFKNKKIAMAFSCLALVCFVWFLNIKPILANEKINEAQYYTDQRRCDVSFFIMEKQLPSGTIIDGYFRMKYIDFIRLCSGYQPGHDVEFAKKGIELLKENVKIMPYYTRNWLMLGALTNVLIAAEQSPEQKNLFIGEGEQYFKKANELSPKRQEVFIEWIKKDLVSKNYQGAFEKSKTCIKVNSNLPDCYWFAGLTYLYLYQEDLSEEYFAIAAKKGYDAGNNIPLLNQLVNAYAYVNDYKKLAQTYHRILAVTDAPHYHASLAFTYRELGEYQKARDQAMTFFRMMPEAEDEVNAFLKTLP